VCAVLGALGLAGCGTTTNSAVNISSGTLDVYVSHPPGGAGGQTAADVLDAENAAAARRGLIGRFRSPHDPFAIVGAVCELVSRQVRLGVPADVLDLAPVIDRLILGLIPADE